MTNLTQATPRRWRGAQKRSSIDMAAAAVIYQGAAIETEAAGGAKNLVGADATFIGIADTGDDNAAGVLGDKRITYVYDGTLLLYVDNAGGAITRLNCKPGTPVYALDGNSFTITATGAQKIGEIEEIGSTVVLGTDTAGEMWVNVKGIAAIQ